MCQRVLDKFSRPDILYPQKHLMKVNLDYVWKVIKSLKTFLDWITILSVFKPEVG